MERNYCFEFLYILQVVVKFLIRSALDYLDQKGKEDHGLGCPSHITERSVISSYNLFQNDREVDWLDLPEHILSLFAAKLMEIKDNVRFGAVCQTWRTVYIANRECALRETVLLMVPPKHDHDVQTRSLYSLSAKQVLNFPVPVPHNILCLGSSHGWLSTVSENYEVCLLNPFLSFNNRIMLPPLTAFEREPKESRLTLAYLQKAVLSANPSVSPNYVVMAIHSEFRRVSFFKPGDRAWTHIGVQFTLIFDLIYHKDKFYAVHNYGHVFAIDVNHPTPKVSIVAGGHKFRGEKSYLVESSGELLQILRDLDWEDETSDYFTVGFTVLKLDPTELKWIEVKSLGGRIVFLGDNTSLSLSVSDLPGCKPNCIYFTDDCVEDYHGGKECGPHDMGVFNVEDGSIKELYPIESRIIFPAPIWVQPTM